MGRQGHVRDAGRAGDDAAGAARRRSASPGTCADGGAGLGPRVAIVGGGASGLACAVACARAGGRPTVFEAGARMGRPILASGNGRCNLTNAHLSPQAYNRPDFVARALGGRGVADVLSFFDDLGVWCLPDDQGRYYPASRSASSVLDPLLGACDELGVGLRTGSRVTRLEPPRPGAGATGWVVSHVDRDPAGPCSRGGRARAGAVREGREVGEPFDAVVWAAGGGSPSPVLSGLGVRVTEERPALCPLATETDLVSGLDGVRAPCRLRVLPRAQPDGPAAFDARGEVLFRPYGISGIVTFDASRRALPGDVVELDLLPDFDERRLRDELVGRTRSHPARYASPEAALTLLDGIAHPALGAKVVRVARGRAAGAGLEETAEAAAALLKRYRLRVTGTADPGRAQVTRGGVATDQVDPETLGATAPHLTGLFVCGEALDVDGCCGGFNLSWAWLSGVTAGERAARGAREGIGQKGARP